MPQYKVTMIGGGTGTFALLSGLKKYDELGLSAVVAVTDDGGSTGRLRDEFGYLPVGDIRQCIVALAQEVKGSGIMRELFNYRFQKGGRGLVGHSFGNLFLTALTDVTGDQIEAIELVSKILRIKGQVIPVSTDDIELAVEQADGTIIVGESNIKDHYQKRDINSRIVRAWLQPQAKATPKAIEAIINSDLIIIGPGGLYTSLIANLLVEGITDAIQSSRGKVLFNVNLMTDAGQTHGFTAQDHVDVIANYIGSSPDYVMMNKSPLPPEIIARYEEEGDYLVSDDLQLSTSTEIIRADLVCSEDKVKKQKDFGAKRSLIRHNGDLVARKLVEILNK